MASPHKPEEYIKGNFQSEIRNPLIAKMLFLSKAIEQFGSGFKRIDSLCKDAGVEYAYENVSNGFKFILYRPQIISDISNVTSNVTYGDGEALNKTEQAVFAVLNQNPEISREEIAGRVSKTVRTVQRALGSLADKGYIRRVGAKKNSTWEILKK
jgi:ATP-dependent DNA helicase RecG